MKPTGQMLEAYADPIGATAAFNLNLLARINRELGGEFNLHSFQHVARWNERYSRIEMHLRSRVAQRVRIADLDRAIEFRRRETIFTESSHKFRPEQIVSMAEARRFRMPPAMDRQRVAFRREPAHRRVTLHASQPLCLFMPKASCPIEFAHVTYTAGGRTVLRDFNLTVDEGETLVLLGRSGSGKTTALKLVNALLMPDCGQVLVDNKPTTDWDLIQLRRRIGYVIQESGLVSRISRFARTSVWFHRLKNGTGRAPARVSTSCSRKSDFPARTWRPLSSSALGR